MECDFLSVVISRQQVEAGDIAEPLFVLQQLVNREAWRYTVNEFGSIGALRQETNVC